MILTMAATPYYVNVGNSRNVQRIPEENVRDSRKVRKTSDEMESPYYSNVEDRSNDIQCEEYQIMQERGRDPNAEYTDPTVNKGTEPAADATLKTNRFLLPPQNNARRFNYTDIQVVPKNEQFQAEDEENSQMQPRDLGIKTKPHLMPKPNFRAVSEETPTEDDIQDVETVSEKNIRNCCNLSCMRCICTTKCAALLLLVISITISVVAVAIATTAFIRFSLSCEQDLTYQDCMIAPTLDESNHISNNSCTVTTLIDDSKVFKNSLIVRKQA